MSRVVITGVGVVSPIGNTKEEFWNSLMEGKHGFTLEQWFPGQSEELNVKASVKNFSADGLFDKKELRRTDIITQYAVYAADKAIKDAGSDFKDLDPYRCGVIIGSGIGGMETTQEELLAYHNKGNKRVSVFTIPKMIGNMAAGTVAIRTGFKGVNYCTVSACASGTHAIGEAFHAIKNGYMDVAIAGGTEKCSIGFAYAGFNNMHAITKSTDVDRASIPFDAERSGFVLGDGSGIVILEEYEHAKARGAKIYCELAGYGATCDAYHMTAPADECGASSKAMIEAYTEAGLKPEDITYINAHGTSTHRNDLNETLAAKKIFGDHAYKMMISSNKSMTGHLLGAAGGVEAIATALTIDNGVVPPTINYEDPDLEEGLDLDYVPNVARKAEVRAALSNNFGFGGHNACILLKKYKA